MITLMKYISEQQSKTGAEAEALLQKENEKLQKELEDQLQFKLEQSLIKKAREAAEVAKQVLETEHKKASLEASQVLIKNTASLFPVLHYCDSGKCREGRGSAKNGPHEEGSFGRHARIRSSAAGKAQRDGNRLKESIIRKESSPSERAC